MTAFETAGGSSRESAPPVFKQATYRPRSVRRQEYEGLIRTGRQLVAARAILGISQADVARAARLARSGLQRWEAMDEITERLPSGHWRPEPQSVRRLRLFFERCGIRFLDGPLPGIAYAPMIEIEVAA